MPTSAASPKPAATRAQRGQHVPADALVVRAVAVERMGEQRRRRHPRSAAGVGIAGTSRAMVRHTSTKRAKPAARADDGPQRAVEVCPRHGQDGGVRRMRSGEAIDPWRYPQALILKPSAYAGGLAAVPRHTIDQRGGAQRISLAGSGRRAAAAACL